MTFWWRKEFKGLGFWSEMKLYPSHLRPLQVPGWLVVEVLLGKDHVQAIGIGTEFCH